jgi:hypothetical protein
MVGGSYPVTDFGISGVEPLDFTARVKFIFTCVIMPSSTFGVTHSLVMSTVFRELCLFCECNC